MACYKCRKEVCEGEKRVEGLHEHCFLQWFHLPALDDFKNIAAQKLGNSEDPFHQINTSFFHGKFKKYSAILGERNYILKVQQSDFPELPATEYLCNEIADCLGLEVPDYYLIKFQNAHDAFVTGKLQEKSFDS